MIHIRVEPAGIDIQVDKGKTLLEGLKHAGLILEKPCSGMGLCGECGIWVFPPDALSSTPHKNINPEDDTKGLRLACQAVPEENITIQVPDHLLYEPGKSRDLILMQSPRPCPETLDPAVYVTTDNRCTRLWRSGTSEPAILSDWKPGFRPRGLAIDIGTTTLVIALVCLETGIVLASNADLNPQVIHGHDVLTRIQYASAQDRLSEMASLVRERLNSLIAGVCESSQTRPREIIDVVIGANTTMLQLAAGMDSSSMGRSPFNFDILGSCSHDAAVFGLKVNRAAKIYLPPILHAFVGTDISAGLAVCPDFFNKNRTVLFIDMGTNGEICLNIKGRLYAASTAAGPAFEGTGISSGMRAKIGAVDRVEYDGKTFSFHTLGNDTAKGICGSGIIDFLAALLKAGYMDASGRLLDKEPGHDFLVQADGLSKIRYGHNLYFTQKDIRQVQLAKSAIRSGVDLLLSYGGITPSQVDLVFLSGGFGNSLDTGNLSRIGLLAEGLAQRLVFCGNTSINGGIELLTHCHRRHWLETHLDKVQYVSLAQTSGFMDAFMANLGFP